MGTTVDSDHHGEQSTAMQVLTTQGPGSAPGSAPVSPKALPLYWSEAMDLALAKQVS